MKDYTITTMNRDEVGVAVDWAAKEGWNPGVNDAECFYQTDKTGFFIGKLDGEIISVGSAICYDESFGFCGFYIVAPPHREKGYGILLTRARLAHLGERNVGIDGVLEMQDKYHDIGYQFAHKNIRYQGKGTILSHEVNGSHLVRLGSINFEQLSEYDRLHFPAYRRTFLSYWIRHHRGAALGYLEEGALKGYGVIRLCREGYKIGPLFADDPMIAEKLFVALSHHAKGDDYYLDIPDTNPHAKALIKKYRLEKVFETVRMYLRYDPNLPLENIYGITTFELG